MLLTEVAPFESLAPKPVLEVDGDSSLQCSAWSPTGAGFCANVSSQMIMLAVWGASFSGICLPAFCFHSAWPFGKGLINGCFGDPGA